MPSNMMASQRTWQQFGTWLAGVVVCLTGLFVFRWAPSEAGQLTSFSPQPPANSATQSQPPTKPLPFRLEKGDHICIIGNTLADRLQHDGWLETYIYARHPQHNLIIRNLGFSGDEITLRLRSQDFGTPDQWLSGSAPIPNPKAIADPKVVRTNRFELTQTRADVIFAFFGANEAWAGEKGLNKFKNDLEQWIQHTLAQKYNGRSAPRLVLFSPIAVEDHRSPHLPTGEAVARRNRQLQQYTQAMQEVAARHKVLCIDLFTPTQALYTQVQRPLTINGIHLTEEGNRKLAEIIDAALFTPSGQPYTPPDDTLLARIRPAVQDKAFHWFQRYRVTDGYSTYGGRAFLKFVNGQTNYEVLQRELEILDIMTHNRDKVIWEAAQGRTARPDDSNLPPFVPVITNKPGPLPGGKHVFLSGEEAIAKMTVGKGLKVQLFADEKMFPELVNPVQMAFDPQGRLWVAVWPLYPHWKPGEPYNDKLLILEDTNGDGKADRCTVFADRLQNPTGFEFYNGGVIVAQAPDLMFLKDTDGDGKADVYERILHGLDTADTHHTANSFVYDPGGALYFQEGTFHHTQVEDPYGPPKRSANAAVFRYEPRTHKFEVYISFAFANPHGHVFDRWGQDIVIDGTGAQPYHATLFSGYLPFPHKHARPPQVYQQRTRPSGGMELLSSQHFPPEFEGNLIVTNCIGFQGLLRYRLSDDGASFKGQELEPILSSSDPNFRPVDAKVGPDGALYFLDWHNPIIGHMQHNLRDPSRDRTHGRIYRVTYHGRPLSNSPKIAGEPIDRLVTLLQHPEDRVRYRVRIELGSRETAAVLAAVQKWLATLDKNDPNYEHARLEALWVHQWHNVVNANLLQEVLHSPEFRARAAAVRVLTAWRDRLPQALDWLRLAINDPHPRVRLEAVRSLSFFPGAEALPILADVLAHPDDPYIRFVFRETLRALELDLGISGGKGGIATVLAKMLSSGQVPPERRAAYIETVCRQGTATDLQMIWNSIVTDTQQAPALRRLALEGLYDAAVTRGVLPQLKGDLSPLLRAEDLELRAAAVRLAGAWKVALVAVRSLAEESAQPLPVRLAAVEALGRAGDAESLAVLRRLGQQAQSLRLRCAALAALVRHDLDATANLAATALQHVAEVDDTAPLIDAFLTRKGGSEKLAAALQRTPPTIDSAKLLLRYLYTAGRSDRELTDVLSKAAGLSGEFKPPTPAQIKDLAAEVLAKGDPARGERLFRRADLGCFKCHALQRAGGNVGPELTALGGSSPVDYIVASVLDPNAAIKEQYTTRIITTVEETVVTGIVVSRDDQRVLLRDATGKLLTIPVKDIESEREGRSLMPEGLTRFLTHQELLDLCRFLAELGRPGPYGVSASPTIQRWRILRPRDPAVLREVPSDAVFQRLVLTADPAAWEAAYATVSGHLPLEELRRANSPPIVYAQGEVELANDGPLLFRIEGPVQRVWIDGRTLNTQKNGPVRLTAGRHRITLRLDLSRDPPGSIRVTVTRPEGAAVHYEIVGGP
jgi:putative heme-binding domain-containing protein